MILGRKRRTNAYRSEASRGASPRMRNLPGEVLRKGLAVHNTSLGSLPPSHQVVVRALTWCSNDIRQIEA